MGYKVSERGKAMKDVPFSEATPELWPDGVRVIGIEEMNNLGIDRNNVLYWNGHVVMIRKRLLLTFWQSVLAAVTAVAAFLVGVSAIAQGFVAYSTWACSVGFPAYCPAG